MGQLTVHHLERSRSQRVLWLLEELEVPYALVRYARHPKTQRAPPELERVHPLGKSPVVTLEDGTVLAESGAIVEHLVEHYGQGRLRPPAGTDAQRRYRFWIHYAEGSLMPPLLVRFVFERLTAAPLPFFVKPLVRRIVSTVDATFTGPEIAKHVAFIEAALADSTWFAGDELSAADILMSFPLEVYTSRRRGGRPTPAVDAFVARIQARDAYRRARERGGPYDLLAE